MYYVVLLIALVVCSSLLADISAELGAIFEEFASAVAENNTEKVLHMFTDDCVIIDRGNTIHKGEEGEC